MKIICDQKDYYDCISAHGQADDIKYVRTTKKLDIQLSTPKLRRYPGSKYLIGFCGTIYPCFKVGVGFEKYRYIYTADHLVEFAKAEDRKFAFFTSFEEKVYRQYFDEIQQRQESLKWVFERYKVPVFHYYEHQWNHHRELTLNPLLNKFEFYRIKDTYTAYQDIQIFLSNLAKPEKPIPEMDNQTKISSHGFNNKSFRKDKKLKGGLESAKVAKIDQSTGKKMGN